MQPTVNLFIGSGGKHDEKAAKIYLHSLYSNTKRDLNITWLSPETMDKDWNRTKWGTPFTCYRYAIPHMMNYKGKALYTDVDMINFRDIGALFDTSLNGKPFGMVWDALQDNGKKGRELGYPRGFWCDSVMLIDCEKAKEFVDPIDIMKKWKHVSYKWEVMNKLGSPYKEKTEELVEMLDSRWNCFDGSNPSQAPLNGGTDFKDKEQFELEMIWQLHLTALSYQPWHPKYTPHAKASHPRQDLMEEWWRLAKIVNSI